MDYTAVEKTRRNAYKPSSTPKKRQWNGKGAAMANANGSKRKEHHRYCQRCEKDIPLKEAVVILHIPEEMTLFWCAPCFTLQEFAIVRRPFLSAENGIALH